MGASAEACTTLTSKKIANPGRKAVAERDDSGHGDRYGEDLPVLAEPICEARNDWPGDQSDRGSRR
jgi:hypothetical protein